MRLTRSEIRIRTLTTTQEARARGIQIIHRLIFPLLSHSISDRQRTLTIYMMSFRQYLLTILCILLVRRARHHIARHRRTIVILIRTMAIAQGQIRRRFRLIMHPFKGVSARASRDVLRIIHTFLRIHVNQCNSSRIRVNMRRLLTFPHSSLLRPLSILRNRLITQVKGANIPILLFIRRNRFPFLIKRRSGLIVSSHLHVQGIISNDRRIRKRVHIVSLCVNMEPCR